MYNKNFRDLYTLPILSIIEITLVNYFRIDE